MSWYEEAYNWDYGRKGAVTEKSKRDWMKREKQKSEKRWFKKGFTFKDKYVSE